MTRAGYNKFELDLYLSHLKIVLNLILIALSHLKLVLNLILIALSHLKLVLNLVLIVRI